MKNIKLYILIGLVVINIALSSNIIYMISKLNIENLQSNKNYDFPNLLTTTYYKNNDVTDLTTAQLFQLDNCLIYFYSPNCSACQESDEYLSAFIYYGLTEQVPIYFVDVSKREDLIGETEPTLLDDEHFKVVYTPTLLQFKNKQIFYYVGPDEIFKVLDSYSQKH